MPRRWRRWSGGYGGLISVDSGFSRESLQGADAGRHLCGAGAVDGLSPVLSVERLHIGDINSGGCPANLAGADVLL